jgi:hypothetical protein
VTQSKAKTSKRVTKPKQVAHIVPEAVRKPANQLLASLTGVMGKELLAEALVTIAGALVGGRYVRSQSAAVGAVGAADNDAPLSAGEAIGRVLGTSLAGGGPKKTRATNKKVTQRRAKSQGTSAERRREA